MTVSELGNRNILINALFIHKKPTGLGIYTDEVVRSLLNLNRQLAFLLPESHSRDYQGNFSARFFSVSDIVIPGRSLLNSIARIAWLQLRLPFILKKNSVGVFYSTVPEGMIYTLSGVRQIITIHDFLPLIFWGEYPRMRYYFKYVLPLVIKSSSCIVCVSESTRKDLYKYFPSNSQRVETIYPGVDTDTFKRLPYEEVYQEKLVYGDYVLFVSAVRRYKNLHRLVRAFGKLNHGHVKLLVVGEGSGEYYEEVYREVRQMGLEKRVYFLDYVDRQKLVKLYNGAIALIFPSLYEGFGLPLLEAMACGCPVIASDRASIPEVCGDAAVYFDPEDVEDMATKISTVIRNESLRLSMSMKGLERARLFTWENTAKKTMDLLDSMLE